MQISYSIYSLPLNQKYNPNTSNNIQNDKKPTSNAALYKLETYKEYPNAHIRKLTFVEIQNMYPVFCPPTLVI